jgi:hypothetical protein
VVGEFRVVLLTAGVADQVHWPPDELLSEEVAKDIERSVVDGLTELLLPLLRDAVCVRYSGRDELGNDIGRMFLLFQSGSHLIPSISASSLMSG